MSTVRLIVILVSFTAYFALAQETQQELPPGPQLVYEAEMDPAEVPDDFTVRTLVLEVPPGAQTPFHYHPGPGIVMVLEGELVSFDQDGQETVHSSGDTFEEGPGRVHAIRNDTDNPVRLLFTILLPVGEELTTVVE